MRAVVVAGVHSGVGKTTVATGLMAAYSRRGLRVQGFKVGPDYIDASYHTAACGRASRTLDGWMLGLDAVSELFAQAAAAADLCVIEGVMGLFDGRTGGRGAGSTAEIAALLGVPILLVVDGWKIARSAAAIVHGYRTFDPSIRIEAVILNNIAGEGHYQAIAPPIEEESGVPVLGSLGRDDGLALPERYLGLIPVTEGPVAETYFDRLAATIERSLDLERILRIAETAKPPVSPPSQLFPNEPKPARARIAIAQDRAFSFYYPDSLDLLTAWGAELVPFSPLDDAGLPEGTARRLHRRGISGAVRGRTGSQHSHARRAKGGRRRRSSRLCGVRGLHVRGRLVDRRGWPRAHNGGPATAAIEPERTADDARLSGGSHAGGWAAGARRVRIPRT